jgi:tRNA (mo5U34)-methyltransferase
MTASLPRTSSLADKVRDVSWYHSIELPGGILTPGFFDLRSAARRVPIPASLAGMRCLDVGASDGFWSFEMERRGAAEVVSLDLDDTGRSDWQDSIDPTQRAGDRGRARRAFEIAAAALGSRVERVDASVYDLSPEHFGSFDFVFMGALLLHLRDPVLALKTVRTVVRGQLLSVDMMSVLLTALMPWRPAGFLGTSDSAIFWWTPNMAGHRRMVRMAGFEVVRAGGPVFERMGSWRPRLPRGLPRRRELSHWLFFRQLGLPMSYVLARPDPTAGD